jgi:hypothetical protein
MSLLAFDFASNGFCSKVKLKIPLALQICECRKSNSSGTIAWYIHRLPIQFHVRSVTVLMRLFVCVCCNGNCKNFLNVFGSLSVLKVSLLWRQYRCVNIGDWIPCMSLTPLSRCSLFWLSIFPVDHVQSVELSIDVSNDSISATHGHFLGE